MQKEEKGKALKSLAIVGRTRGEVRRLAGFDKKRHSVPDRVCGATQGFLEKLCELELGEQAEELFQAVRDQFGYKRREITLNVGSGFARLETKDFALELRYELDEEDAADYVLETSVGEVASRELLESGPFNGSIGNRFDRLRCTLAGQVSVESVIDAVEADETGLVRVEYPSDCSSCTVRIEGMPGEVYIDGAVLEVRYGKLTSAAALMGAFESVGERLFEDVSWAAFLR